jgi:hypothetical protein
MSNASAHFMSLLTRRDNVLLQKRHVNKYLASEQPTTETFFDQSLATIRNQKKSGAIFRNRPFA